MPTVAGAWAPTASTNRRMRLVVEYTTTQSTSALTISGTVYVEAGYSFNDSSNSFSASGTLVTAWSGAKSVNVATNGRQAVHTFSNSHARGTSNATKSMAFALSGIDYVGATASVAVTASIPAKPVPATPGSVVITRVSLTRLRITWTGGVAQWIQVARRAEPGSSAAVWNSYETLGSGDRASGVEFDVSTGYEWAARVARIDEGVISGWGYYSTGPARLFDAPPSPTGVSTTYQADNRRTTDWAFSDTAARRATAIEFALWKQSTGSYGGATSLASSARNRIDTASLPNDRVRSRVRAVNAAGTSAWVEASGFVSTTPAAPTGISAARSGSNDMLVTLTNRARSAAAKIDILGSSSPDGASWSSPAAITGHTGITAGSVGNVITRTITGLDATRRWRFYARAWVQEPAYLSAVSGASNVILLLQPPIAPKMIAPVTTQPAGAAITFHLAHQSMDGSAQTAAEVRYRIDGDTWVTRTISGAGQQVTTTAPVEASMLEWQARTRGAHADFGAWSGIVSVLVADRPTVSITSPDDGAPWPSNRLTLAIAYADGSGASMTRYRRILRNSTDLVLEDKTVTASGAPGTTRVHFDTVLADGAVYRAEIIATSGTGLTSTSAVITVPVIYLPPGAPMLVGQWQAEDATVSLTVGNVEPGAGVAETTTNRIERSTDGGSAWVTAADGVSVDGTTVDQLPPFREALLFRVVAISALGAEAVSDPIALDTTCGDLWLNGENGARCRIELDLALQVSYGHTRVAEEYFGLDLPEAHYGQGRPVQWRISGALLEGQGLEQDWRVLLGQDSYLREPGGDAMWVSIQPDGINQSSQWVKEKTVTLTADAVAHE